jgi:excisionase family DNA binding protein
MEPVSNYEKLGYSIDETARSVGLSRTSVKNLIASGRLRTVHVGRRVIIPRREVAALLEAGSNQAPPTNDAADTRREARIDCHSVELGWTRTVEPRRIRRQARSANQKPANRAE